MENTQIQLMDFISQLYKQKRSKEAQQRGLKELH